MPDAAGGHPATSPLALPIVATPTDDQLIASARAGDGFAAARLWHRHETAAAVAAAATPGSAEVEAVVEAAEARFDAAILSARAPTGAMRPHVLAAVREAAAAVDGRGTTGDPVPALLAPEEWYRSELPSGLADGEAIAVAFTSLGTSAQEALWLAEIDGLAPVDVAAELGLTPSETEGLLATAHEALRSGWIRQTAAARADCDGVLAEIGAPGTGGHRVPGRVRSHVDGCDGCRAAALPAADLAHRLVGLVPLLVLGAPSGIGFLEATRPGSSSAVLAPIPALARDRAAFVLVAAAAGSGAAAAAAPAGAASATGGAVARVVRSIRRMPRAALVATSASLAAAAAAIVLVAAVTSVPGGPGSPGSSVTGDAGAADISAAPPGMSPPEIVSTDVPADPRPTPDDETEATPPSEAAPGDEAAEQPAPPAEGGSGTSDPGTDPGAADPPAPEPGGQPIADPDDGVSTPVGDPEQPGLSFTVGDPGEGGWRPLTVTGQAGAEFTIFDSGRVLLEGVLDTTGTANFAIRGSVANLTIGYSSTSVTAGGGSADALSAKATGPVPNGADRQRVAD